MDDDPRARAYFDARALPFDRLYDRRSGLRGRLHRFLYGPLLRSFERTMEELGDLTGRTLLDVGCGSGRYAVAAAECGAQVVGVDLSPRMLALARRRARDHGVADRCRFIETGFDSYRHESDFDVVLMMSFLEYRPEPRRDLARLGELARQKAVVRIPVPYGWRTLARRARHRLRGSPPTFFVHSPAEVVAGLAQAGFDRCRSDSGWFVAWRNPEPSVITSNNSL